MMGSTILWKIWISLAPSILAASISDFESVAFVYCLRKNTIPGDFNLSTEDEILDVLEGRHNASTLYKTIE